MQQDCFSVLFCMHVYLLNQDGLDGPRCQIIIAQFWNLDSLVKFWWINQSQSGDLMLCIKVYLNSYIDKIIKYVFMYDFSLLKENLNNSCLFLYSQNILFWAYIYSSQELLFVFLSVAKRPLRYGMLCQSFYPSDYSVNLLSAHYFSEQLIFLFNIFQIFQNN